MIDIPIFEKMAPENEEKFRQKIKTQIGLSKDLSSSFGGKSSDYLKKFNQVNRNKIRALQIGVAKGLQKKFPNVTQLRKPGTANLPFKKAA